MRQQCGRNVHDFIFLNVGFITGVGPDLYLTNNQHALGSFNVTRVENQHRINLKNTTLPLFGRRKFSKFARFLTISVNSVWGLQPRFFETPKVGIIGELTLFELTVPDL